MTKEVTTQDQPEVTQEIQLQEYGLAEFIKQIEVKVNAGYALDLDSNEGYPQQYGTLYTVRMLKTGNRPSVKFDVLKEPMFLKTADKVVIPDPVEAEVVTEDVPVQLTQVDGVAPKVDGRTKQAKNK